MVTINSDDVIDLCESFIRVNLPSYMRDVCIVLDSDDSVICDTEDFFPGQENSATSTRIANTDSSKRRSVSKSSCLLDNNRQQQKNIVKKLENVKKGSVSQQRSLITQHSKRIGLGECPICYERLGKNPLASTRCGHVYCMKCLEQALLVDQRCPTCRQKLKGRNSYHPLYIDNFIELQ